MCKMISFCKIGCKGTIFCSYSQKKCTKSTQTCTFRPFCAINSSVVGSEII